MCIFQQHRNITQLKLYWSVFLSLKKKKKENRLPLLFVVTRQRQRYWQWQLRKNSKNSCFSKKKRKNRFYVSSRFEWLFRVCSCIIIYFFSFISLAHTHCPFKRYDLKSIDYILIFNHIIPKNDSSLL